ncbi:MAG: hypothetical protein ACLFN5_02985 [bacterium]
MNAKEHAELTKKEIGRAYIEVHTWMDRYFDAVDNLGPYHRSKTHHVEGALETADEMIRRNGGGYSEWLGYLRAALEHLAQDMVRGGKQYRIPRKSDYPPREEGYLPSGKPWENMPVD